MALVVAEHGPEPVARVGACDFRKVQDLGHHQHHDKAAVTVDRDVTDGCFWRTDCLLRYGRSGSFKNALQWSPPCGLSLKSTSSVESFRLSVQPLDDPPPPVWGLTASSKTTVRHRRFVFGWRLFLPGK